MGEDAVAPWKMGLAQRAEDTVLANRARNKNLMRRIYDSAETPEQIAGLDAAEDEEEDAGMGDDFLKLVSRDEERADAPVPEAARPAVTLESVQMWEDDEALEALRTRFITGDAASSGAAEGDDDALELVDLGAPAVGEVVGHRAARGRRDLEGRARERREDRRRAA